MNFSQLAAALCNRVSGKQQVKCPVVPFRTIQEGGWAALALPFLQPAITDLILCCLYSASYEV